MRCSPDDTDFSIWVSDIAMPPRTPRDTPAVIEAEAAALCIHEPMYGAHTHEDHEIILILAGAGNYTLSDGRKMAGTAGQILVIPGGIPHGFLVDDHVILRGFNLHPRVCRRLMCHYPDEPGLDRLGRIDDPLPPRVVTDARLYTALQELFEQCQAEYAYRQCWRTAYLRASGQMLAVMLMRLMRAESVTTADPTTLRVLNVQAWMDRHFLDRITLNELAEMASLSSSQFSAIFRQLTGCSPKAYLISRRLNQAADLLAATDLSVTEVAMRVGIDHLTHFGRLFREHTGETPSAFRKKARTCR